MRPNVADPDRVAVILLKDLDRQGPARIGLLDVGGATIEDLEDRGVTEAADARGRVLFENKDIERCREFQRTLKDRFAKELAILDPDGIEAVRS